MKTTDTHLEPFREIIDRFALLLGRQAETRVALTPVDLLCRPYCPICGSDPDLAVLINKPDPSEYLVSKGGEVWHHCPTCTHRWRFVHMVCAGCGNQDHKTMNRFTVPGSPREYIYACDACRQYLPCLDLVERADAIDSDQTTPQTAHLDAAAQASGYTPISPALWTALGFAEDTAKAS